MKSRKKIKSNNPNKATERYKVKQIPTPTGSKTYRVSGYRPDGLRFRKNFRHRADALECRTSLELEDENLSTSLVLRRTSLTDEQISDATAALGLIQDGKLVEHLSRLRSLEERVHKKSGLELEGAVAFFEQHYSDEIEEVGISAAIARFLDGYKNGRKHTLAFHKRCTNKLMACGPNMNVSSFNRRDIDKLLGRISNVDNRRVYLRSLNCFFNWAMRERYCLDNPCQHIKLPRRAERRVPVLGLEEVRPLLKASTMLYEGELASSVAILLFAGLRPSELEELESGNIRRNEGFIAVSGGKMRDKIRRRVPIPPVLDQWLKKFPFTGRPDRWDKKFRTIRNYIPDKLRVSDILRHTSITFQVERDQEMGRVAMNNGTSEKVIKLHYLDVLKNPADCGTFWELVPAALRGVEVKTPEVRKVEWPPVKEFKRMLSEMPVIAVARKIGVSDNAVRKHCIKHGIDLPNKRTAPIFNGRK